MNYHRMYSEKQKKDINLTQDIIFFFYNSFYFIEFSFFAILLLAMYIIKTFCVPFTVNSLRFIALF